jgi:hypothetical protein
LFQWCRCTFPPQRGHTLSEQQQGDGEEQQQRNGESTASSPRKDDRGAPVSLPSGPSIHGVKAEDWIKWNVSQEESEDGDDSQRDKFRLAASEFTWDDLHCQQFWPRPNHQGRPHISCRIKRKRDSTSEAGEGAPNQNEIEDNEKKLHHEEDDVMRLVRLGSFPVVYHPKSHLQPRAFLLGELFHHLHGSGGGESIPTALNEEQARAALAFCVRPNAARAVSFHSWHFSRFPAICRFKGSIQSSFVSIHGQSIGGGNAGWVGPTMSRAVSLCANRQPTVSVAIQLRRIRKKFLSLFARYAESQEGTAVATTDPAAVDHDRRSSVRIRIEYSVSQPLTRRICLVGYALQTSVARRFHGTTVAAH